MNWPFLLEKSAGVEGIEPPTKVLETSIIPFNYTPKINLSSPWRMEVLEHKQN
jgi:hypothetical protein